MNDFQSLILYLSVFIVSCALVYVGNKKKFPFATILGLLLPVVLAALRYNVGTDYPAYIRLFDETDASREDFDASNGTWTVEPTFWLISVTSRLITGDATLMFGIYSAITVGFFYLAVKGLGLKNVALTMFLFYCFWFGMSLSAMRQFAAISIFMFALQYLMSGNLKKYVIWLIAASTLHVTALLLIPLYYIRNIVKKGKDHAHINLSRTVLFTAIAMVASVSIMPMLMSIFVQIPLFSKYEYMLGKGRDEVVVGGTFIAQVFILLISLALYKGLIRNSYTKSVLLLLFSFGISLYTFGFIVQFAYRFSLYLLPISILLLGSYTVFIEKYLALHRLNLRLTPYLLIGVIGAVYFISVFYLSGRFLIFPYNFIWQGVV